MPEPFAETPSAEIRRQLSTKERVSEKVDLTVENIKAVVGWVRAHKVKAVLLLAFLGWNLMTIIANLDGLLGVFDKIGTLVSKATGIGGN